ncbi:MAG: hydroxymethylglutaryl-CoA lyase [Sphingobacteriia bacterium]|jgi:hydroxymethylglutaryl-CoA lyase
MQGWKTFIPTEQKIQYLNQLLKVGFDVLDCGSFVSPKAIPQMGDTASVIRQLDCSFTDTKLLVIVANARGAEEAVVFDQIHSLGFPFSISPEFQLRNTNSSMEESLLRVETIQELCIKNKKELVIYLSMGFGNPYGDAYTEDILLDWVSRMAAMDIKVISLADTVGLASPDQIQRALTKVLPAYPLVEIGVHLHASPLNWQDKLSAAYDAGCTRFDGAFKGIGGCPMAQDDLVGNMDTELMIPYFQSKKGLKILNQEALLAASSLASSIFH